MLDVNLVRIFSLSLSSVALVAAAAGRPSAPQDLAMPPSAPLTLRAAARVAKGSYVRQPQPAAPGEPACVLRAAGLDGALIDLRDVQIAGTPPGTSLDQSSGFGLYLTDCRDVTVRGGTFSGFRGAIVAERCSGLQIEGVRFDGNFATRLKSTLEVEDEDDWLRPHDNDNGEWLARYGAALSLTDCVGVRVSACRARHGQNGLLLTRSRRCSVYDNDFSFLSGWGIALYRSSENLISRNRCDYCVRGFSAGRYWRGQDSAGILLFERCSDNVIAENSARCGGDGLFVYAGEDLVAGRARARGELAPGGCDNNLIWRNDFSNAVANGVEITFSRGNRVLANVAQGCLQHGLWGGYSSRMGIADNDFSLAQGGGVTIEHGQECVLSGNLLERCAVGLELYWDEDPQYVQGPFGAHNDTASRDHWVFGNSFAQNDSDLGIARTARLAFSRNIHADEGGQLSVAQLEYAEGEPAVEVAPRAQLLGLLGRSPSGFVRESSVRVAPESLPEEFAALIAAPEVELLGRNQPVGAASGAPGVESIVIGEWGPWDFESGEPRPVQRSLGGALAGVPWEVRWFRWDAQHDPRGDEAVQARWRALAETPALGATVSVLADPWAQLGEARAAAGEERFGLLAAVEVELAAGRYRLRTISDDGIRVRVDGALALEDWTWHPPKRDDVLLELAAGRHRFEVEYFQIDGSAALSLDLVRL